MKLFFVTLFVALICGARGVFAAEDLITADKTLFVQFAIFLVALYVLNSLFFKPLMELADKRDKATSGSGREADELAEKTRAMTGQYSAALKEAREQALAKRARLTKTALAEAEEIVSSAREQARSLLEKRTGELAVHVDKVREEMRSEIEDIAGLITRAVGDGSKDV